MEFLQFSSPDVAAKYQSTFKGDPEVHIPCDKGMNNGFKRKLSTITMGQADRIFSRPGQNLLQLKETHTPPPAAAKRNGQLKENKDVPAADSTS